MGVASFCYAHVFLIYALNYDLDILCPLPIVIVTVNCMEDNSGY